MVQGGLALRSREMGFRLVLDKSDCERGEGEGVLCSRKKGEAKRGF